MPIRFVHRTGVSQTVLTLDLSSAPNLPFSFACFFEPESTWTAVDKCLVSLAVAGGNGDSFRLDLGDVDDQPGSGDTGVVRAKVNDFVLTDVAECTERFSFYEFNHAAAVFAGSGAPGSNPASSVKAYCNGVASAALTTTTLTPDNTSWLFIGGRGPVMNGQTQGFPGCMAHVGYWRIALSDAQVALLAAGTRPDDHATLGTQEADLVGYWELIDEASATTATVGSTLTLDDDEPSGYIEDCDGDPIPGDQTGGQTRVIGF